jgi:hypothetical protein
MLAAGVVSLEVAASGTVSVAAELNINSNISAIYSTPSTAAVAWHSAAVVDFAGDGRNVAVLVRSTASSSSPATEATMLSLPSLRILGGEDNPRQLMDDSYAWNSIAATSLSDAYGVANSVGQSSSLLWQSRTRGGATSPNMQQLVGLRSFPLLSSCPSFRGRQYGDNTSGTFCCRTNLNSSCVNADWNMGGDVTNPGDVPCCLRPGSRQGCGYTDVIDNTTSGGCTETRCAQAPPCGVAPTSAVASGRPPQFVISLLVFGDGALWQPRRHALAQVRCCRCLSYAEWLTENPYAVRQ